MALVEFLSKEEEKVRLIPEQLASWIEVELTETETICIFAINGTLVSQYSDEAQIVINRNDEYALVCHEIQTKSAFNKDAMTQTCDPTPYHANVQTDPIIMKDTSCWSSSWDLYDSFTKQTGNNPGSIVDLETRLLFSLNLTECLLSLNLHQKVLMAYRKSATNKIQEHDNEESQKLATLWTLESPIVDKKAVTCLAWNMANQNLLCVGYGDCGSSSEAVGLICCWSLKNLLHPQRCLYCPGSITSVDFSDKKPNILACGLEDGTVMVWDILMPKGQILWTSRESYLHHYGPVRAVKWAKLTGIQTLVKPSVDVEEVLITISDDGKACKWVFDQNKFIKKDFLRLKAVHSEKSNKISIIEPLMSYEPLYSIGFNTLSCPVEKYLIGSGLGTIHLCSTLYQSKCLSTYIGHQGPVYKICVSRKTADAFLTCSADWTIKLWRQDCKSCLLSLQTNMNPVCDVAWSPFKSTMFASICSSRLDIWDLNRNILEPLITEKALRKEALTIVLFSENSTSLFVGNADGKVKVYLITGLHHEENELSELLDKLVRHMDKLDSRI